MTICRCCAAFLSLVGHLPTAQAQLAGSADVAVEDQESPPAQIVITGEKAPRSLQSSVTSVAVTTGRAMAEQNLLSLYDILDRTPNLVSDANRTSFSIRGIDASDVSGGGYGALASVYVDGAVLPHKALGAGGLDIFDVSQVEVFRGPQSTIQGRNALAGAVIIRTADPTFRWSGHARLLMTDENGERRMAAALGGPIVSDQIAFRMAGEVTHADGLIHNVTAHVDADRRLSKTFRAKLLITPSALPGLSLLASYMHGSYRRGTLYTEFSAPYEAEKNRISTEDVPGRQEVTSDIATLEATYDLAERIKLHSVTSYGDTRSFTLSDPDRSPAPGQASRLMDPTRTFQQEFRLNIDGGWAEGLIGAYYLSEDNRGYSFDSFQELSLVRLGVDRQLRALGLSQPMVDTVLALYRGAVPIRNSLAQPLFTRNYAGFADFTFSINRRLRILAGLRYDHESQKRGASQTVEITGPLPNPAALPTPALAPVVTQLNALLRATADGANTSAPVQHVTYHAWLPRIGVVYDASATLSMSLTAQRGYRSGGTGLNQQRAQAYEFDPEYTWNYEAALRSQWFDRRLAVNANAYWMDWRDQQISVQLTPGAVFDRQVVNAGRSRLHGFELQVTGRPVPSLDLYAGIGHARSRFRKFDIAAGDTVQGAAEGNEFARAPRWTLSYGATYRHASGLVANLNANHRSGYYQDPVAQTARDVRARTLVNARIGWQGRRFGAFLIGSNLLNVQKATRVFLDVDGRTRGTLNDPRVLGLTFEGRL